MSTSITTRQTAGTGATVKGSPLSNTEVDNNFIGLNQAVQPAGGTAGQILAKIDATNFNSQWVDNYAVQVKLPVKNATGATIPKGAVVYVSGATGANALISLAQASGDSTSATTVGFLESTLATGDTGLVVVTGVISGIDTSAATEGDPVWLSGTTAGGVLFGVANKPQAPTHIVYLGTVTRAHATVGEIQVHISNGWEIEELHDVKITSKANNDTLFYNSAQGVWVNAAPAAARSNLGLGALAVESSLKTVNGNSLLGSGNIQIDGGVTSFNTRTGAVTLSSSDVTTALGFTPYNSSNPNGYITSSALSSYLPLTGGTLSGSVLTETGPSTWGVYSKTSGYNNWSGIWFSGHNAELMLRRDDGQIATRISANGAYAIINNNQILHAGNYWNYALPSNANFTSWTSNDANGYYRVSAGNSSAQLGLFRSGSNVGGAYLGADDTYFRVYSSSFGERLRIPLAGGALVANGNTVLDAGNYSSYALPLSGGTMSGNVVFSSNGYITFGPNTGWGSYLRVGGNGFQGDTATASVSTTNGNLHLDSSDAVRGIYLNWYGGDQGTYFGNGATGQVGRIDGSGNASFSGTISTAVAAGTMISHGSMSDAFGWNGSYGTYIGSTVGGTKYLYANGSFYDGSANRALLHAGNYSSYALPLSGGTVSGVLTMPQNPAGTTYGAGVSASPPYRIEQGAGNDDGWRLYGESSASNNVRMVFEVIDDIETAGYEWLFRNKRTYGGYEATEPFRISGAGEAWLGGNQVLHAGNYSTYSPSYGYFDDYTRGNYRVIADYSSSGTWYIRSNGYFIWARAHDWTQSFSLNLGNGSGGSNNGWAEFGQQTSNTAAGTWFGTRFVQYTGSAKVDGSVRAAQYYLSSDTSGFLTSTWAGGGGYHGYYYQGGNSRFGFSSSGGVVDVYADGNFYATDSSHLVLHAGNYGSYALPLSGGTLTSATKIKSGHGETRFQLHYNHDNNDNSSAAGYLTLWASEPGISYPYSGIGGNINIGGQYYGRQSSGQPYGVYLRFETNSGQAQFWSTTGSPGATGGQGSTTFVIDAVGNVTATNNVTAYSDERLKTDWAALPADFVMRLAQVRSGTYTRVDSGERQAGSSAQDWQKLLPEVVHVGVDEDNTLALAYGNAALVSAIELAKDNVELRARIERLESLIETLIGDQK